MTILLDECVPWPMHKLLAGHSCTNAQKRGWRAVRNGDLIRLAETEFCSFCSLPNSSLVTPEAAKLRFALHGPEEPGGSVSKHHATAKQSFAS